MSIRSVAGILSIAALASAAGCQRDVDTVRAELTEKQAVWQREIGTFKAQHAAIAERFARQPMAAPDKETPAVTRMRATLQGVAQSLIDVEMQSRQVGARVEQAVARGGDAAQKALDEDGARMNEYFQALAGDLAATGRALDDLSKTTPAAATANSVDEGA
jgi:hypothetical protein